MTALVPPKTVKAYNNGNFQRNQTHRAERKKRCGFQRKAKLCQRIGNIDRRTKATNKTPTQFIPTAPLNE